MLGERFHLPPVMTIPFKHLALSILLGLALPCLAQNNPGAPGAGDQEQAPNNNEQSDDEENGSEDDGPKAFWQARLGGGHYLVALRSIASIAKHEYISDGAARVVEITVSTNSSIAARFYYLEPLSNDTPLAVGKASLERLEQVVRQGATRAGSEEALDAVVKSYPATTHAHTVEFRLQDEAHLGSLYRSLHNALETGRGRIWNDPNR